MSTKTLFSLSPRLALCASFVRYGCRMADIGTDHAYLPVWLAKSGYIKSAVAADIRPGPLENGRRTIETYHVQQQVAIRLTDGLLQIAPEECDDIVIAGMGGEQIVKILSNTVWIQNPQKRLILQPMSKAEALREYLFQCGFNILQEKAVFSEGKLYTVLYCTYTGISCRADPALLYCGRLQPLQNEVDKSYIAQVILRLQRKASGLSHAGQKMQAAQVMQYIESIQHILEGKKKC